MIRTLEVQKIDPKNRFEGVVYIEAKDARPYSDNNLVTVQNNFYTLETKRMQLYLEREVTETYCSAFDTATGVKTFDERTVMKMMPALVDVTMLVQFDAREAKYKKTTFDAKFGNITPAQFDEALIQEIVYLNNKDWTGQEIQKVLFWNLGASDMKILTAEQVQALHTQVFVSWID